MVAIPYYYDQEPFEGTYFYKDTPVEVKALLGTLEMTGARVEIRYGDITTGRDWGHMHRVLGHVLRAKGRLEVPFYVLAYHHAAKSRHPIWTSCVVKVSLTNDGSILYKHENYNDGKTFVDETQKLIAENVELKGLVKEVLEQLEPFVWGAGKQSSNYTRNVGQCA